MKKRILSLCLVCAFALGCCSFVLGGCGGAQDGASEGSSDGAGVMTDDAAGTAYEPVPSDTLYVKQVVDLPDGFIYGMDISSVLSEEESGVVYRGFDGNEQDIFMTLAEAGVTHIRVRVWNDPFDAEGHGYGGGNVNADRAAEIGKRAAACGLKLIVSFHYSDFWADPKKQMVPKAWKGMEIEEKSDALYEYTKESLQTIADAGSDIDIVSIGNETNGMLCGEKRWAGILSLMTAGSKAVRETCPGARIAVHFANPENSESYADYAWRLDYYSLDYDIFASSYYPFWHGTLENLSAVLKNVHDTYGKDVMVMETSYAFTSEDSDFNGNTISDGGGIVKDYPFTVQGQANSVRNVIDTVAHTPGGIGVCYWEGAWITVGGAGREENEALWEQYGSGWASSYSAAYDPNDAGKYYGGSAVDNQALFDADGYPLESLKVFGLVRTGNDAKVVPDALEDTNLQVDLAIPVELPATVNAIMTDDSRQAMEVTWDITETELSAMNTNGVAKYEVLGQAGGMTAHCYISMIEYNYLDNYSFEDGVEGAWVINDIGGADELKLENKATDSMTGDWHYHFWSGKPDSVEFTLEQDAAVPAGKYKFTISIMGGDGGLTDIYAYVKIGDEIVAREPLAITQYNEWHTATVHAEYADTGSPFTVGIYVKCAGEGSGAWGKIDDALLNSESD